MNWFRIGREPGFWGVFLGMFVTLGLAVWLGLGGRTVDTAVVGWILSGVAVVALLSFYLFLRSFVCLRDKAFFGEGALEAVDADTSLRLLSLADDTVFYANQAAKRTLAELGPLTWVRDNLAEDVLEQNTIVDRLKAAVLKGVPESLDILLTTRDGPDYEPRWYHVDVRPAMGGVTRLWTISDITPRRVIDEVLIREREELADFLFFLPVGLYSADSEGRLRYVNQVLAAWLGESAEALIGLTLTNVMEGNPPAPDGAWEGRVQFRATTGTIFDARVLQASYDDAGHTLTRSVVLRIDPGDAQSEVRADPISKRQRLWMFDDAPVGIALSDPDGRLTDCNASFLALLGESKPDDLLDRELMSLAMPEDQPLLASHISRVMEGQAARARADVRLSRGEGEISVSLFLSRMALKLNEPSDGLIIHLIDTTEQKRLEEQVAQAGKMQAMGQLAGGIAHDFNNLLTAMIGFSELLLQRHGVGDPSFADIMQIRQNANRAANLVRQLLAFSRRQPLRPQLLNVTDALAELSHLLRRLLGEQVSLKLSHARSVVYIRVDPSQFDQVIINLAVNARDAMPKGGSLTIATRTKNVARVMRKGGEEIPPGDYVMIEVTDTGSGISREDVGRIFEPFFTTKAEGTAGAGTGLGLSTVYGIIRQTEGYIFVDSEPGEGARFSIFLPRQAPPNDDLLDARKTARGKAGRKAYPVDEPLADAPTQPELPLDPPTKLSVAQDQSDLSGRGTILFVEDEDAVRVFGARALRNKGYTVLEARTGEGALDVLDQGGDIDVLITDMVMPGMDGAKLAEHVLKSRPDIPIILISGYSEDVIDGDIVGRPNTHFLPKPFSLNALAGKVREVLTGT